MNTSTFNSAVKTILITGGNRGIGFGIVKNLLQKNCQMLNRTNNTIFPYKIIFTTRNQNSKDEVYDNLKSIFNENENLEDKLSHFCLDVSSEKSIENLISQLSEHEIKLDILVNNAGVYDKKDPISLNCYDYTFSTNVFGTINLTEKILENEHLLNKDAKIILIGSVLGDLKSLTSENLKNEFKKETDNLSLIYELSKKFKKSIADNVLEKDGWPKNCYYVSKMMVNKYAQILSKYENMKKNGIQVYSCHPGWVKTDMGGDNAPLTIEEGIVTPIYLIELENKLNEDFQGKYFSECKVTDCGL